MGRNLGVLPASSRAGPLRLVAATQPRSGGGARLCPASRGISRSTPRWEGTSKFSRPPRESSRCGWSRRSSRGPGARLGAHPSFLQPWAGTGVVLAETCGGTHAGGVGQASLPASSGGIPAARFHGRAPPPNWEHGAGMPRHLAGKDACPTRLARSRRRVQETELRPRLRRALRAAGVRVRKTT